MDHEFGLKFYRNSCKKGILIIYAFDSDHKIKYALGGRIAILSEQCLLSFKKSLLTLFWHSCSGALLPELLSFSIFSYID